MALIPGEPLRQTGRTSRMLLEACSLIGKDGVVLIVGRNEQHAGLDLRSHFERIAAAVNARFKSEWFPVSPNVLRIRGTEFHFVSMHDKRIDMAPIAVFEDHQCAELRWHLKVAPHVKIEA